MAVVNAQPATPAAPTVNITQPTCTTATGTITITAPTAVGMTYSIDGTNYQSGTTFSGLAAGSYSVTAKNSDGCISAPTTAVVNAQPGTPAAPTVNIVHPTCSTSTGEIFISAPIGAGMSYSINGTTYQSSTTFSGLSAGTYSVTVRNSSGCTSNATAAVVNPQPATGCGGGSGIYPTITNCGTFSNGTATPLSSLCYTSRQGSVTNVTPGVFFYFAFVTAPSTSFTVDIQQTALTAGFKLFRVVQGNQAFMWKPNCLRLTTGIEVSPGQASIQVTNAVPGARYVISVKYDSKTAIGSSSAGNPIANYNFVTRVNGVVVAGSATTIPMIRNCSQTARNWEPGNDGFGLGTLYPNPTSDRMTVQYAVPSHGEASLRLYSLTGQLLLDRVVHHESAGLYELDLSLLELGLNDGVYYMRLMFEGEMATERVLFAR